MGTLARGLWAALAEACGYVRAARPPWARPTGSPGASKHLQVPTVTPRPGPDPPRARTGSQTHQLAVARPWHWAAGQWRPCGSHPAKEARGERVPPQPLKVAGRRDLPAAHACAISRSHGRRWAAGGVGSFPKEGTRGWPRCWSQRRPFLRSAGQRRPPGVAVAECCGEAPRGLRGPGTPPLRPEVAPRGQAGQRKQSPRTPRVDRAGRGGVLDSGGASGRGWAAWWPPRGS